MEENLQSEVNEDGRLPGKLSSQIQQFTNILLQAGHKHVGKVKPGRKTRVWLTPPVRAAIRQRNLLRRKVKTHRRDWLEQCKVVKEEIKQAKEQKWREVVEEAIGSENDKKIWSFIKSLDGTTGASPTGEVMIHGKDRLISNKAKANVFSSHYASVSRLNFKRRRGRQTARQRKCSAAKELTMNQPSQSLC